MLKHSQNLNNFIKFGDYFYHVELIHQKKRAEKDIIFFTVNFI